MSGDVDDGLSPFPADPESDLPRVPLPTLQDSVGRFLEWCAPLLTAEERAATDRAAAEFLDPGSPAHALQAALEEYDGRDDVHSWLDEFWRRRYLGRRDRIALNANFFFLFTGAEQDQVQRAAGLVVAALDHKRALDAGLVPPVVQQGRRLSSQQDRYLFSATRIPGPEQDTMRTPHSQEWPGPSRERHVVVFVRGRAFRLDVLGPTGRPYALEEIADGLRAVLAAGAVPAAPGTSTGHLTTMARAAWAASRRSLLAAHPGNALALDTVETALFCLCLEDAAPADTQQACDVLLHGNSGNRWYDKALQLVVFPDGTSGLNAEHAELDGTTILNFVDAVLGEPAEEHARRCGAQRQGPPLVQEVEFVLDAGLRADVQAAADAFAAHAADTVTSALSFEDVGADSIKRLRMSPDAFVQMAYQLAHRRTKGHVGSTYESIATRQYRHGRTEAMRVVTPEVLAFLTTMDEPGAGDAVRRRAFRAAADAHVARARQCQAGQAPEQHLWALQLLQQHRGPELGAIEPLALHASPGWRVLREDHLSTSSAPSAHIRHFGFGSTSPQCIGIAYVLLADRFDVYLSTPRAVGEHLDAFGRELRRALDELQELLASE